MEKLQDTTDNVKAKYDFLTKCPNCKAWAFGITVGVTDIYGYCENCRYQTVTPRGGENGETKLGNSNKF